MIALVRALSLLLLLTAGCGDAARQAAPAPATGGSPPSGAAGASAQAGAEQVGEAGADSYAGAGSGPAPVVIVDVPDAGPAEPLDQTPQVFMAPEPLELVFDRAAVMGSRRMAFDSASLAIISFETDEASASPIAYGDFVAAAPFAGGLTTLELDGNGLVARSYDAMLAPLETEMLRLDDVPGASHALGASSEKLLALWCRDRELRGELFMPGAAEADELAFGPSSCGESNCVPWVLWSGERFVALWSRVEANGHSMLSWAAIEPGGSVLGSRNVLEAEQRYQLAGASQLADGRVAVLLTEGAPAEAPVLLFLDQWGAPESRLHRLLGASEAWGVASVGEELAVAARSLQAQAVLRRFDLQGEPAGGWLQLDDSGSDTAFEPRAALFSESGGYGLVVRLTDGSASYLHLE
jgi:hypothetical protein